MSRVLLSGLAASMLLAAGAQAATVDATTTTVKGRAPVAAPTITPTTPMPGDTVTVDFFSDLDGDVESGSTIQWLRNGSPLSGATSSTLLLNQTGIGGDLLSVRVTPRTDPAITDPAIGSTATSAPQIRVGSTLIANFLTPDGTPLNWNDADNHCRGLGARLPTVDELQQLYKDATRSPVAGIVAGYIISSDMCLYGWPVHASCAGAGGVSTSYWTSSTEPGVPDEHYVVTMLSGARPSSTNLDVGGTAAAVACTR